MLSVEKNYYYPENAHIVTNIFVINIYYLNIITVQVHMRRKGQKGEDVWFDKSFLEINNVRIKSSI